MKVGEASCRHQIADFTGKQALHPAQVLAARLKKKADSNGASV